MNKLGVEKQVRCVQCDEIKIKIRSSKDVKGFKYTDQRSKRWSGRVCPDCHSKNSLTRRRIVSETTKSILNMELKGDNMNKSSGMVTKLEQITPDVLLETTNYDLFEKVKGNRDITNRNDLEYSIGLYGILVPIMIGFIDGKFRIVDGQHRFQIASNKGLVIPFYFNSKLTKEMIIPLNNLSNKWKRSSFRKAQSLFENIPEEIKRTAKFSEKIQKSSVNFKEEYQIGAFESLLFGLSSGVSLNKGARVITDDDITSFSRGDKLISKILKKVNNETIENIILSSRACRNLRALISDKENNFSDEQIINYISTLNDKNQLLIFREGKLNDQKKLVNKYWDK